MTSLSPERVGSQGRNDGSSQPQHRVIRVLVALEQQLFGEVLRVALAERGGYDVVSCKTIEDIGAVAMLTQADVVLMDLESERAEGLAALRRVREASPSTAVLILSSSIGAELLSDVMRAGAAGFLSMEADMMEVINAVQSAADGQVVLSGRRLEALVRHLSDRAAPRPPAGPGGQLTPREHQVLVLLAQGTTTGDIATSLFVSTHTARTHVQNVLVKLGVHSRLEAAAFAVRHGLVDVG